jgi:D-amino-acid dehydrogenase
MEGNRVNAKRVVVVGGGVAGLSTAYFLRHAGAEVTVLDAGAMGEGASAGNAGWVCPAQAGPLPAPGLTGYGLRSLVRSDSALYFSPRALPRMATWLLRFAAHCNARDHRQGTTDLARLGGRAFELMDRLAADGVAFELYRQGFVVAGRERASVAEFAQGLEPLRALGFAVPDEILEGAALHALEPALAPATTAGLRIDEHWHVQPSSLMNGLVERLRSLGVALHEGAAVTDLGQRAGGERRVHAGGQTFAADAVVLAAGAWSPKLARTLGLRLPIQPGKGYSFEVRTDHLPRQAVMLLEPHVGCSPFTDRLRIAGTMEFTGVNTRIDQGRVRKIIAGAAGMLRGLDGAELERVWTGMRPIAPDGLPIVDRAPGHEDVYLATAYSMLGMTIGVPAGEALADMILTGRRPAALEPFRAARFSRLFS